MVLGGGGFDLGTAHGKIILSLDDSAVKNAPASIGALLQDIGGAVKDIGSSLTTLTAPILAFGLTGLKAASDFDTVITQIRVFGELGPQDLERVRLAALKWGADTKFSALDASAGMLDLLKSGQSVEQMMATMPGVLNLAGAGNLSLAQSAGIVSAALAQFRLNADQAGMVANSLAKAANASRAEVGDLGEAMVNVGPVAAQFGLSFDDTSAILATFANNGIMGAEAGTKLRTMLVNMTETTKPVKDAWKELGVSIYDANGNTRDFNTVLVELDAALDKLPVQRQNELMVTLAGTYGLTGLTALRAAGGIDAMRTSMQAAPDAATLAAEFMNTFEGKVESLRGSIETLQIEGLTPLMNETLAPMVDRIIGVVNSLTAWIQANPELAGQIMKILAILVTVGPVLVVIGMAISAVGTAIGGLGTLISIALGPIGLLIAGAALLFIAFQNNFLGIRDLVQPIIDQLVGGVQTLLGVLGHFGEIVSEQGLGAGIDYVLNAFAQMFGFVGTGDFFEPLRGAGDQIVGIFLTVADFITGTVVPAVERFVGLLSDFWTAIQPGLNAFFTWVTQEALPLAVDFFNDILRPAIEGVVNMLMDIWEVVSPALSALFNWFMTEGLPWITDRLREFKDNILQPAIDLLKGIWDAVGPALGDLVTWFQTDGLPEINRLITAFKDDILQPAIDVLKGIWDTVQPHLQKFYDWFVSTGLPFIKDDLDAFKKNFLDPIIKVLTDIWTTVQPHLENFKNGIGTVITWISDNVLGPFIITLGRVLELFAQLSGQATSRGMDTAGSFLGSHSFSDWSAAKNSGGASFRDSGGAGMADVPYLIGRGAQPELFVPSSNGTFIPNADKLMGGGGDTFNFETGAIQVSIPNTDPETARTLGGIFADSFEERIKARRQSRGG